jgi:ricin-type beta-trefoil lectin protein
MCSDIASMLLACALLGACRSTPLDVVYAADDADASGGALAGGAGTAGAGAGAGSGSAGSAGAGGGAAGAGGTTPCSVVGAGSYVLRSQANGLCLGQGAPTTVFGNPAFLLDFAADCRHPARSWQLSPTTTPSVFSLQNQLSGFVLDVQMAGTRDGTPVLTYGETGLNNQRFEVRARNAFASELRPQHHAQSCVSAAFDSAQIASCEAADPTQAWLLQRSDCL